MSFQEELSQIRIKNFKNVFIKNQSGDFHFLCTYLLPANVNSLKGQKGSTNNCLQMDSFDSIFHFVNCIQYESKVTKEILLSPDFLLSQNKGDLNDHSILLACLFMGLK